MVILESGRKNARASCYKDLIVIACCMMSRQAMSRHLIATMVYMGFVLECKLLNKIGTEEF